MRVSALVMLVASIGAVSALPDEHSQVVALEAEAALDFPPAPGKDKFRPKPPPPPLEPGDPHLKTNGSMPLTFHKSPHGHRLTVPVSIGAPPQRFELDIRLGSGTTWVVGDNLVTPDDTPVSSQHIYVPRNSSRHVSGIKGCKNFNVTYADSTGVDGTVYLDRIRIGDCDGDVGYWKQEIGVAKTVHPSFASEDNFHGVLGLGKRKDQGGEPQVRSLLKTLRDGPMHVYKFSIAFKENGGHMNWGFINESRYTGPLFRTWCLTEVSPQGTLSPYHMFNITGHAIGDGKITQVTLSASPDPASPYILLPLDIAEGYYKSLGPGVVSGILPTGQLAWQVPCNWTLPDLLLEFTNYTSEPLTDEERFWKRPITYERRFQIWKDYKVPGADLVLQETSPGLCLGAIVAKKDDFFPKVLLGWPFMKNRFVVFSHMNGLQWAEAV